MKSTRTTFTTALMVVALTFSSLVAVYSVAAENNPALSKKELKVLLTTAKTPAEHLKIAAYYQQAAQRLTASAKDHEAMAAIYAKGPATIESKQGTSFGQGASHCRRWAELEGQQAKEAANLATLHESMAKQAEQK